MRITPRSSEVVPLALVLESDQFESSKKMAAGVLKESARLLGMRDSWIVSHQWPGGEAGLNYGPFWGEAEARAFIPRLEGAGGAAWVCRVSPPALLLQEKGVPGNCAQCEHLPALHHAIGVARGRCAEQECNCQSFTK